MLATPDMAIELRCALDPVAFAVERLGFHPDPWQADVLRLSDKNTLLNCSRQAGKSTTTALLGAIVASVVENVFVGGNLGIPITTWIADAEETEVAVVTFRQ